MLNDYHESIIDVIKKDFGDVLQTVTSYFPADDENNQDAGIVLKTPAALLEIEMLDGLDAVGDGRTSAILHIAIHCILGSQTKHLQQELRNFAVQMLLLMEKSRFCGAIGEAEDLSAMPGGFDKDKNGYDSFVVCFSQKVILGESDWSGTDIAPTEVFFRIGRDKDYERVL